MTQTKQIQHSTNPLLPGPLPDLFILADVDHDLVGMVGNHSRMTLGPIVGDTIREEGTGTVECGSGDRARCSIES